MGYERNDVAFIEALRRLINAYSKENDNDTPDYILAQYMNDCLESYSQAVKARDKWFGVDMWTEDKIAKFNDGELGDSNQIDYPSDNPFTEL